MLVYDIIFLYLCYYNAEKLEACKLLKSLMDEIVKDCNMARQLQKQTMELMKSVDGKKIAWKIF